MAQLSAGSSKSIKQCSAERLDVLLLPRFAKLEKEFARRRIFEEKSKRRASLVRRAKDTFSILKPRLDAPTDCGLESWNANGSARSHAGQSKTVHLDS